MGSPRHKRVHKTIEDLFPSISALNPTSNRAWIKLIEDAELAMIVFPILPWGHEHIATDGQSLKSKTAIFLYIRNLEIAYSTLDSMILSSDNVHQYRQ